MNVGTPRKIFIINSNHRSLDGISDWIDIIYNFLRRSKFEVEYSPLLVRNETNIIIDEFVSDPSFVNDVIHFKKKEHGRIIVVLTEFITKGYLNNFSLKHQLLNLMLDFYFGHQAKLSGNFIDITAKEKKSPPFLSAISRAEANSISTNDDLSAFDLQKMQNDAGGVAKLFYNVLKKFKTKEKNLGADLLDLHYLQGRLIGCKRVLPYVDCCLTSYPSQRDMWSKYFKNIFLFDFKSPCVTEGWNTEKTYDFSFTGTLTRERLMLLDSLAAHFRVGFFSQGFATPMARNELMRASKFSLCLPRTPGWQFTSCTRSWASLREGAIPINRTGLQNSIWEKGMFLPEVKEFTLPNLVAIHGQYETIKAQLIENMTIQRPSPTELPRVF